MELTTEQRLEAAERHITQLLEKDKSNREEIGAMKKRLTEVEKSTYKHDDKIEKVNFANDFVNAKAETSRGRIDVLEIMFRALIGSRYIHNKVSEYAGRIMATMSSEDEIPDVLDEGGFMSIHDGHKSISDIDKRLTGIEGMLKNGAKVNLPEDMSEIQAQENT